METACLPLAHENVAAPRTEAPLLPVIVDPFSLLGDTVAGETPDEVALNLADCLRVALIFRCKRRRPLPDLRDLFYGRKLSPAAQNACRWVTAEYSRITHPKHTAK